MDCGIGIEKPLNDKQLLLFLANTAQRQLITQWVAANSHPIATSLSFSCLNHARTVSFYIFDALKLQNLHTGFDLYQRLGTELGSDVEQVLLSNKREEVQCSIDIKEDRVQAVRLEVFDTDPHTELLEVLDCPYSEKKLAQALAAGQPTRVGVHLHTEGASLQVLSAM